MKAPSKSLAAGVVKRGLEIGVCRYGCKWAREFRSHEPDALGTKGSKEERKEGKKRMKGRREGKSQERKGAKERRRGKKKNKTGKRGPWPCG